MLRIGWFSLLRQLPPPCIRLVGSQWSDCYLTRLGRYLKALLVCSLLTPITSIQLHGIAWTVITFHRLVPLVGLCPITRAGRLQYGVSACSLLAQLRWMAARLHLTAAIASDPLSDGCDCLASGRLPCIGLTAILHPTGWCSSVGLRLDTTWTFSSGRYWCAAYSHGFAGPQPCLVCVTA